ncbi:hypothetical protein NEDG_01761 [Nematocida displodere]|uniref:Uncharacterized protein n=1 Tax=Nematocida displodere TaxID=1805483 RepID=A0A177EEA7_9MICR|nr:hypothetical protein NEDG_01761 [Nematocida displodere]
MDARDVAALADIVSYEYATPSEAKDLARAFLSKNDSLPDDKRLFVESFCASPN